MPWSRPAVTLAGRRGPPCRAQGRPRTAPRISSCSHRLMACGSSVRIAPRTLIGSNCRGNLRTWPPWLSRSSTPPPPRPETARKSSLSLILASAVPSIRAARPLRAPPPRVTEVFLALRYTSGSPGPAERIFSAGSRFCNAASSGAGAAARAPLILVILSASRQAGRSGTTIGG